MLKLSGNKRNLTLKQQRFCQEYLIDFNATAAAKRAGYSKKTAAAIGDENLKKPALALYLSDRLGVIDDKLHEDVVLCLEKLKAIANELTTYNPTSSQLKAVELLLKYHGMLIERSESNDTQTISIQVHVDQETQDVMGRGLVDMMESIN